MKKINQVDTAAENLLVFTFLLRLDRVCTDLLIVTFEGGEILTCL
jgi:hypothetical protein